MKNERRLEEYLMKNLLKGKVEDGVLTFNGERFYIVDEQAKIFDEDFKFLPSTDADVDGYVYIFGGRWYTQDLETNVRMEELKHRGSACQRRPMSAFLGIHSGHELLNGVGLYKDWIKKAKFLGVETLGICEKHTLSGVIEFQNLCEKNDIKPIFGMSLAVDAGMGQTYDLKLYVKNFSGWLNLLRLSKEINVEGRSSVKIEEVEVAREGLIVICDPKTMDYKHVKDYFMDYYLLDTVEFENEEKDAWYVENLKAFLQSSMGPVASYDAYYLDQPDYVAREILWAVAKVYSLKSKNQYFKSFNQYAVEVIKLFEPGNESWKTLWGEATKNLELVTSQCNFLYDTVNRRLPKYVMTEEESERFETKEQLFLHLIKKGFEERKIEKSQEYIDRLKEEIRVLQKGDVLDYFLVLYDIIRFAKKEKILVGIGRGSAGGSLVSFLLGLIQINPLDFDLLFERFLNDGRMGYMKECDAFEIENEDGETVTLNEGSLLRIERREKEMIIFVEELREGDNILKY